MKRGFYFIATPLDMRVELPQDITPNIRLERATHSQITVIRKYVDSVSYYETDCIEKHPDTFLYEELPEKDWRYYVLSFNTESYGTINRLLFIASIVYPYLTSNLHFQINEVSGVDKIGARGFDPHGDLAFNYQNMMEWTPRIFDIKCLESLRNLFSEYNKLDKQRHEGILRAIRFHRDLQRLGRLTNLPVLGLFTIIEMLLTHKPNDKEIGDSLSHQIRTKIAFINRRLETPLDYTVFDDNIAPEIIWGKLYSYRSRIAHGDHIDFSRGELAALKNNNVAFDFLDTATKALLVHAIKEPDTFNDLKPI